MFDNYRFGFSNFWGVGNMKISMKISMKIKALAICCLPILATTFLSACNTVEGFGKDVKSVGQSMENAAAKKTGN